MHRHRLSQAGSQSHHIPIPCSAGGGAPHNLRLPRRRRLGRRQHALAMAASWSVSRRIICRSRHVVVMWRLGAVIDVPSATTPLHQRGLCLACAQVGGASARRSCSAARVPARLNRGCQAAASCGGGSRLSQGRRGAPCSGFSRMAGRLGLKSCQWYRESCGRCTG